MFTRRLDLISIDSALQNAVQQYNIKGGWDIKKNTDIDSFKSQLKSKMMINQNGQCCYCERDLSENLPEIEHIANKARYPGQTFNPHNLAYACRRCNVSIHKGQINVVSNCQGGYDSWEFTIVHPYFDDPLDYFEALDESFIIKRKDNITNVQKSKADKTIQMFDLNCEAFVSERTKNYFFEQFSEEEMLAILTASMYKG